VPQVLKAWREGDTAAISKRMYVASLIAYGLWIVHGLMITSVPVILFNGVNVVFAGIILALKLRGLKATEPHRRFATAPAGGGPATGSAPGQGPLKRSSCGVRQPLNRAKIDTGCSWVPVIA
jgi:MtN3 and saliva related transmembrane protein